MSTTAAGPLLQLIRHLAEDRHLDRLPDSELLHRFSSGHEEGVFRAILRRHGAMVLDVCRHVLSNLQDAEDTFQATFLVLAQKAGSIRKTSSLSSWLYGVAYRTALKAQAEGARRRKHEALTPPRIDTTAADELSWREVQQILHVELNRLSERHRAPLVVCYLQGKTQDEAALLLGISKAALKKRLERARALLRIRLGRRGLGPTVVLSVSATTLCSTLLSATARAARLFADGQTVGGLISAPTAALTKGVLNVMLLTKLKTWTAVVLAIILLGAGAGAGFLKPSLTSAKAGDDKASPRVSPVVQAQKKGDAEPEPPKADETAEKKIAQLKPLVARLGVLLADLSKSKRTNAEIVDTLYAATLVRLPKESEQAALVKHLQGAKDRTAACRDLAWALLNSREFLKLHDLEGNVAETLRLLNTLSEELDGKSDAAKPESKKPPSDEPKRP